MKTRVYKSFFSPGYIIFTIILLAVFLAGCASVDNTTVEKVAFDWKPEKIYTIDENSIKPLYRIISFDGGGIKGALTSKLLLMLTQSIPGLLDHVDLYAGTSTGGIISLGLAYGKTPADILDLYLKNGNRIFAKYPVSFCMERGIVRPLYTNSDLQKLLKEQFPGNPVLGGLKKNVVVTTFQLDYNDMWSPLYLHNFKDSPYINELVTDAALKTGAAPVFFPAYIGCIDGGVFANNPSLTALAMAIDTTLGNSDVDNDYTPENAAAGTADAAGMGTDYPGRIRVLSFGTGFTKAAIKQKKEDWGAEQWLNPFGTPATPLLSILMQGVSETDDYQCGMILKNNYKRFDIELLKPYSMDDWQHVYYLVKETEDYVKNHPKEWNALVDWVMNTFL